jgi:hypothetical protein
MVDVAPDCSARRDFGQNGSRSKCNFQVQQVDYNIDTFRLFLFQFELFALDSSQTIGNLSNVLNLNRVYLKFHRHLRTGKIPLVVTFEPIEFEK